MFARLLNHRCAAWLAVLAILMAALAPTLSQAFGSAGSAAWTEVCSSQGSKWVQGGESGDDSSSRVGHTLDHCPYCSIHAPELGAPPVSWQPLPAPASAHAVPSAFLAAPRTLHAWVSAQPRAPPLFS